jgi:hypothetical protein
MCAGKRVEKLILDSIYSFMNARKTKNNRIGKYQ